MAIRIDIEWGFVSPALQIAEGVITVNEIDTDLTSSEPNRILLKCKCKIEHGSRGYSALSEGDYIPGRVFDVFRERIDIMMQSFFHGVILQDKNFHWIDETLIPDFDCDSWISKKQEQIVKLKELKGEPY